MEGCVIAVEGAARAVSERRTARGGAGAATSLAKAAKDDHIGLDAGLVKLEGAPCSRIFGTLLLCCHGHSLVPSASVDSTHNLPVDNVAASHCGKLSREASKGSRLALQLSRDPGNPGRRRPYSCSNAR